jgi:hypothetical protein
MGATLKGNATHQGQDVSGLVLYHVREFVIVETDMTQINL